MKLRILPKFVRNLACDERGTSLIELALFLPLAITMLVTVVDLTSGFAVRVNLHQAAHGTIELVQANRLDFSEDDRDFLVAEAARAGGVAADDVTLTTWLECDGVVQDDFEGECADDEPVARYVQVRIEASYQPLFLFAFEGQGGGIPLFAEAAVRIQ